MSSIEQIINRQIEMWEIERHAREEKAALGLEEEAPCAPPPKPVIALAPQLGCGSREVSEALHARLNYEIYGFRMIDLVADDMEVRRQLVDRMDQRNRSYTRSMFEGLLHGEYVEQSDYFNHLVSVFKVFVAEGGSILIGRGAPFLIKPGWGIRARLIASKEKRVENLRNFYDIDAKEAERRMEKSDEERAEFSRKFFKKNIDDPEEYDLTINTDRLDTKTVVDVILRGLEVIHCERRGDMRLRPPDESDEATLERQIRKWERDIEAERSEMWEEMVGEKALTSRLPCIAFSSNFCSGSRLVAQMIQQYLGYEALGSRLIDRVAEDMTQADRIVNRLDHRTQSAITRLADGLIEGRVVWREEYFRSLARVLRALIVHGGVTLLGRGAAFLIKENEGLRVRLTAPREKRLRNIEKFYNLEGKAAADKLKEGDKELDAFTRQYYVADRAKGTNFDLVINTDRLAPAAAADVILRALVPFYG